MKRSLCAIFLCLPLLATAQSTTLNRGEWGTPRSGSDILALPAVKKVLDSAVAGGGRISLRHPGGDAGTTWARELRDWLVALGIESDRILLEPGSDSGESIRLELKPAP